MFTATQRIRVEWAHCDLAKLVARAMPDEVRAMLSVDKTVDVTV